MAEQIARLRVEIDEVTPAVVRRIEVPLDIRLDDLHFVLQIAIGWQNCHPFEFRLDGRDEAKRWGLELVQAHRPLPHNLVALFIPRRGATASVASGAGQSGRDGVPFTGAPTTTPLEKRGE